MEGQDEQFEPLLSLLEQIDIDDIDMDEFEKWLQQAQSLLPKQGVCPFCGAKLDRERDQQEGS